MAKFNGAGTSGVMIGKHTPAFTPHAFGYRELPLSIGMTRLECSNEGCGTAAKHLVPTNVRFVNDVASWMVLCPKCYAAIER